MKQSLSFYITIFIIRLKGLKKLFRQDPIDFKKLRESDVYVPKANFFKQNTKRTFQILKTQITEIKVAQSSDQLLIFIHGGAYVSGPAQHHWDSIHAISKQTKHPIWMCDYPKAPEHQITEISANIDAVYEKALEAFQATEIILIGDSVGATLIMALVQRLVKLNLPKPQKIILISPVVDATMSNPEIIEIDKIDPMLSQAGVLSAKKMCAGNIELKTPLISPLNGSFNDFPETIMFLAENDITFPDQQLAVKKLLESKVDIEVVVGENMPHIWPLLPVMTEAKNALQNIIKRM